MAIPVPKKLIRLSTPEAEKAPNVYLVMVRAHEPENNTN